MNKKTADEYYPDCRRVSMYLEKEVYVALKAKVATERMTLIEYCNHAIKTTLKKEGGLR